MGNDDSSFPGRRSLVPGGGGWASRNAPRPNPPPTRTPCFFGEWWRGGGRGQPDTGEDDTSMVWFALALFGVLLVGAAGALVPNPRRHRGPSLKVVPEIGDGRGWEVRGGVLGFRVGAWEGSMAKKKETLEVFF